MQTILKNNFRDSYDPETINHNTLQMYADSGVDVSEYDIVTIARNPWDRMVSFYCHHFGLHRLGRFVFPLTFPEEFGRGESVYITFPYYYTHGVDTSIRHMEDFLGYLEVDGEMPKNLRIINFENYREEMNQFKADYNLIETEGLPHMRPNNRIPQKMRDFFLGDPDFVAKVSEMYAREIEYFGYIPPSY